MDPNKEERSLPTLLSDLTHETTTLVRQEIDLAKAEISAKVSQVGNGLASIIVGGGVAVAGFLILLQAAAAALSEFAGLDPWLSFLIVGLVVLIIGLIMLQAGKSKLKASHLAPRTTAESLRRDRDLVKEQV